MGGKQKRAAKYKKWMENQNLLKQNSSNEIRSRSSDEIYQDGSGDHRPEHQSMTYQMQQDVLKHRARKGKKNKNNSWISRKMQLTMKSLESWLAWPCTIFVGFLLTIFAFFLIRNLIQMFLPQSVSVDRSSLYNGIRMAVPRPLYKFIRLVDYLFTSPVITYQGISSIMYPPAEGYHHRYHNH